MWLLGVCATGLPQVHHEGMKKCDLVMKGGITSGVVYPAAVCELAREYRFVNIGGTSAGAIAAALTAAAEYRRQGGDDDGFRQLEQLPEWLAGGDGTRLLSLFRSRGNTAPLFDAFVAYLTTPGRTPRKVIAALQVILRSFNRYGAIVLVPGLVVLSAIAAGGAVTNNPGGWALAIPAGLIMLVATAAAYAAAAVAEAGVMLWRELPRQGYGLCSGNGEGALTPWLDRRLRDAAGVSRPLTFGDLVSRDIHLHVMTTNLTHGRPYRLPAETRRFFFSPREWRELFPSDVVDAMIASSLRRSRMRTPDGATCTRFRSRRSCR